MQLQQTNEQMGERIQPLLLSLSPTASSLSTSHTQRHSLAILSVAILVMVVLITIVVLFSCDFSKTATPLSVATTTTSPVSPSARPIVTTKQGRVQGIETSTTGVYVFYSLPFAVPPIGSLRWMPPIPPLSYSAILDASIEPPRCSQGGGVGQEDCLYLNVWTNNINGSGRMIGEPAATMVFIHGGSSLSGYGGGIYHQSIVNEQGIVAVSVNYRVGVLGYLALDVLSNHTNNTLHRYTSGNYGILDNIQALRWIKENIAVFGGDPSRVTIWGQSTGGTNVMCLYISPLAQGLFDAALSLSGSPVLSGNLSFASQQNLDFLFKTHCDRWGNHTQQVVECLYALSSEEATAAMPDRWQGSLDFGIPSALWPDAAVIIVDQWVIPVEINTALSHGYAANVTLVYGHMEQEAAAGPINNLTGYTQTQFEAWLTTTLPKLGWTDPIVAKTLIQLYPLTDYNNDAQLAYLTIINDITYCGGVHNMKNLSISVPPHKQPIFHYLNGMRPTTPPPPTQYAHHGWDMTVLLASWPNHYNVTDVDQAHHQLLSDFFVSQLAKTLTITATQTWLPFNRQDVQGVYSNTSLVFTQSNGNGTRRVQNLRWRYCEVLDALGLGAGGWAN